MTDSFTACWRSWSASLLRPLGLCVVVACLVLPVARADGTPVEAPQVRVDRTDDGLYLSAQVRLDLTPVVEDALLKGVPMFFVAEAEVFRSRWYWTDQKVIATSKSWRLAYQPLTRRWRLNAASGSQGDSGLGSTLNQNFDSLAEAMVTLRKISRWRIGDGNDLAPGTRHYLNFRFRLDVSQLPRPFQIGAVGQPDWSIGVSHTQTVGGEAP